MFCCSDTHILDFAKILALFVHEPEADQQVPPLRPPPGQDERPPPRHRGQGGHQEPAEGGRVLIFYHADINHDNLAYDDDDDEIIMKLFLLIQMATIATGTMVMFDVQAEMAELQRRLDLL